MLRSSFWTAVFDQRRLRAIDLFLASAEANSELRHSVHRFGGTGFRCGAQEIAHVHGNGLLDAQVGRMHADALIREGAVEPHHVFGPSAWVSFWIRSEAGVATALDVLEFAREYTRARAISESRAPGVAS
jgi:hypothetical protein